LKHILVDVLGMTKTDCQTIESELVNVVKVFSLESKTAIELLEPSSNQSVIKKYLNKKGQGIHHIALEVDSIENAINHLKENKISLVYDTPQVGADKKLITFIHPKSSPGLLIELCQRA